MFGTATPGRPLERAVGAAALLQVQLSGAILADYVAQSMTNKRLSDVLEEAEQRCRAAAWRKYIEKMF
jgi:hypothetical protein